MACKTIGELSVDVIEANLLMEVGLLNSFDLPPNVPAFPEGYPL